MPDSPGTIRFPCTAAMVATARHAARSLVAGTPRVDDVELVVSEFVTNSVRWSESGTDGRQIELAISVDPGAKTVRIEVFDAGRRRASAPIDQEAADEHGNGLLLVARVAKDWGHRTKPNHGAYWAVLTW